MSVTYNAGNLDVQTAFSKPDFEPHAVVSDTYTVIPDANNGSYSNYIQFDANSLGSTNWFSMASSYILMPISIVVGINRTEALADYNTNTAGFSAPTASANPTGSETWTQTFYQQKTNYGCNPDLDIDYMNLIDFRGGYYNLIDRVQVKFNGGVITGDNNNGCVLQNLKNNTELIESDYARGNLWGYERPSNHDEIELLAYVAASGSSSSATNQLSFLTNRYNETDTGCPIVSSTISNTAMYYCSKESSFVKNSLYDQLSTEISNPLSSFYLNDYSLLTDSSSSSQVLIKLEYFAYIKLKDLHDFFAKVPIQQNAIYTITLYTNVTGSDFNSSTLSERFDVQFKIPEMCARNFSQSGVYATLVNGSVTFQNEQFDGHGFPVNQPNLTVAAASSGSNSLTNLTTYLGCLISSPYNLPAAYQQSVGDNTGTNPQGSTVGLMQIVMPDDSISLQEPGQNGVSGHFFSTGVAAISVGGSSFTVSSQSNTNYSFSPNNTFQNNLAPFQINLSAVRLRYDYYDPTGLMANMMLVNPIYNFGCRAYITNSQINQCSLYVHRVEPSTQIWEIASNDANKNKLIVYQDYISYINQSNFTKISPGGQAYGQITTNVNRPRSLVVYPTISSINTNSYFPYSYQVSQIAPIDIYYTPNPYTSYLSTSPTIFQYLSDLTSSRNLYQLYTTSVLSPTATAQGPAFNVTYTLPTTSGTNTTGAAAGNFNPEFPSVTNGATKDSDGNVICSCRMAVRASGLIPSPEVSGKTLPNFWALPYSTGGYSSMTALTTQTNVNVSQSFLFPSTLIYRASFYIDAFSKANNPVGPFAVGIPTSSIGYNDTNYGVHTNNMYNLTLHMASRDESPFSINLQMNNSTQYYVDYQMFLLYEKRVSIDTVTGNITIAAN